MSNNSCISPLSPCPYVILKGILTTYDKICLGNMYLSNTNERKSSHANGSRFTDLRYNPNASSFPTRKELPSIPGAPEGAAWFWGPEDSNGRLNLLTPTRVLAATKEIKTGTVIPLNLPLNVPKVPAFGREEFKHEIKVLQPGVAYDDLYHLNTQSGTQWDGMRHFAHIPTGTFYNNTHDDDIVGPERTSNAASTTGPNAASLAAVSCSTIVPMPEARATSMTLTTTTQYPTMSSTPAASLKALTFAHVPRVVT